jgi:hypothetical protein
MSPDFEIARISAPTNPKGRDSGLSGRPTKISMGFPSHAAEYTTVCPSGANRAERIAPRRNVSWRNCGGGRSPAFRIAKRAHAPTSRAVAATAATRSAQEGLFRSAGAASATIGPETAPAAGPDCSDRASRSKATSRAEKKRSSGFFSRQ